MTPAISADREQVLAVISNQRPVVVLAGAIDAGKRLFMKQAGKTMFFCGTSQNIHD